jgi:putative Holliday junction resolvase
VRDWFEKTKNQFPDLEWQLIDERLTSVVAGNSLQQLGKTSKEQRKVVDEFAAVLILEQALATREKSN